MIKIALDGMGGDVGPSVTIKGAMQAVEHFNDVELFIYGDVPTMAPYLKNKERITLVQADSVVDMGEKDPIRSIRNQRDSSMVLALRSVKEGTTKAVVSAGPTQALIVGGHLIIKRMKKMHRVALAPIIPSLDKKGRILLDTGANVELRALHILELSIFASLVAKSYLDRQNPKVGLINIGSEEGKGRELDKEAYELMKNSPHFTFGGNVEAKDILTSDCDVLITDGFTGNIVLKTMEGTAKGMGEMLKEEIKSSLGGKIGYLFMKKNLKRFSKRLDASEVGGAMIFGLNAPVIKAHGSSNATAIFNAIRQARTFVISEVIPKAEQLLEELNLDEGEEN